MMFMYQISFEHTIVRESYFYNGIEKKLTLKHMWIILKVQKGSCPIDSWKKSTGKMILSADYYCINDKYIVRNIFWTTKSRSVHNIIFHSLTN